MNKLVRQYKEQLTAPLQANLRKLRTKVEKALGGEDNVKVYIYISQMTFLNLYVLKWVKEKTNLFLIYKKMA